MEDARPRADVIADAQLLCDQLTFEIKKDQAIIETIRAHIDRLRKELAFYRRGIQRLDAPLMPSDIVRDARLQHVLAAMPNEQALSLDQWSRMMEHHKAYLAHRPDPLATWDDEAWDVLGAQVQEAEAILGPRARQNYERPANLYRAITASMTYVPFAVFLAQLTQCMTRVLDHIERDPARPIVLLAIHKMQFSKSYMWFLLYLWHTMPRLRAHVHGVVEHYDSARAIYGAMDGEHDVRILYVDDMAYSGGQIKHFFSTVHRGNTAKCYGIAVIPYASIEAKIGTQPSYSQVGYLQWLPDASPIIVPRVIDKVAALFPDLFDDGTLFKDFKQDPANTLFWTTDERYQDLNSSGDTLARDREVTTIDRLFNRMGNFFNLRPSVDSLNEALVRALWTYYRLTEVKKPVVIFEHKVADVVSISTRLMQTTGDNPVSLVAFRPRHGASRDVVKLDAGSVGFYKKLKWSIV